MKRILIWGNGHDYRVSHKELAMKLKADGQIVGITAKDESINEFDGYKFIPKSEIQVAKIDYIAVMATSKFGQIFREARTLGFSDSQIINIGAIEIGNDWKQSFQEWIHIRNTWKGMSIFTPNCSAGNLYNTLGLSFLSPMINMFEMTRDYMKLMWNLQDYMEKPLKFYRTAYNVDEQIVYPIFLLGDIRLYMLHYENFDLAIQKWEERKKRINWDDILPIMYTERISILKKFEHLPYKNKICLVPFQTDSPIAFYTNKADFLVPRMREMSIAISQGVEKNYCKKIVRHFLK